ncbi:AAA family ATPase [Salegentibacter salarius]|uniref:Endonuclease n=1 Tax=Salegentibacter salarius TaxID=435906 RepID=A0A2N0TX64_9FLAO|nr:AAA family ATPase [Salegentibacter salarius]OEY72826.1 endonuclease [Salegentibacter salarius]PKD19286.1 endonuclease [Salegentibacter salarius]SLK00016.1 transitional endoplasmic reticulum ATPase [Salegentibacter salarius]
MKESNQILKKGQFINDKYKITFFLKKGSYAETYRVKDPKGKTKLLKLFAYSKLDRTQFDENSDVLEIQVLKKIKHPNLVNFIESGELLIQNQKYAYAILDFISGETLADRMKREDTLNPYEAKDIISGVLNGLNYLHSFDNPIIHNDITNLNVMLDLSGKVAIPKIIDLGYARYLSQSYKNFLKDGLNPFYQANEGFNKVFSVKSDIFSVGALYYHLLEGLPPWFVEISKYIADSIKLEDAIIEERKKPLKFSSVTDLPTQNIIGKALQPNTENRFNSVKDFLKAINGEMEVQQLSSTQELSKPKLKELKKGKGFSAIAGLDDLKNEMRRSVIDVLQNPEKAKKYGAKLPNGMVLYGPPGCGKTFFAKHFAEEVGFNFILSTPSRLKSRYVNATQENIAQMFEDAEKDAPTIIFIDEINELLPNRDSDSHEMSKSAVNEMLAQMDRTGEKGIFIIGATNYPAMIDPAMLRSGRLEKKFYLPPPDLKLRKALFEMSLNVRKMVLDFGIDYDRLSTLTENYVSSDIESIVNEATSIAMADDSRITMDLLEKVIQSFKPFPKEELRKYQNIKAKMEGKNIEQKNVKPRIGFKNN